MQGLGVWWNKQRELLNESAVLETNVGESTGSNMQYNLCWESIHDRQMLGEGACALPRLACLEPYVPLLFDAGRSKPSPGSQQSFRMRHGALFTAEIFPLLGYRGDQSCTAPSVHHGKATLFAPVSQLYRRTLTLP